MSLPGPAFKIHKSCKDTYKIRYMSSSRQEHPPEPLHPTSLHHYIRLYPVGLLYHTLQPLYYLVKY